MKQLSHLVIILPCHSLEDFPTHYRGDDAADLLTCWTSLWHPALIATTESIPQWMSADYGDPVWQSHHDDWDHPEESAIGDDDTDTADSFPLVVLPQVSESICPSDLLMQAENDGVVVSQPQHRLHVAQQAAESCVSTAKLLEQTSQEAQLDFYALGYAFLQVQLMTRQLRYSSNLDEQAFENAVVAAAKAAIESDANRQSETSAEDLLIRCFDILLDEKNAYYPVDPQLCDVVLMTETTLGASLSEELKQESDAKNFLLTGDAASLMVQRYPENAAKLKQQIEDGSASIVGGMARESQDWLMDRDAIARNFQCGHAQIQSALGTTPQVFMRRTFGVSPVLPGILNELDYIGAVHSPVESRGIPVTNSGVIRWEGVDDESILTLGDRPMNAAAPGNFLGLGVKIGEMIDSAHTATVLFARWPNRSCQAFEDLQRIVRISPLFGTFVSLQEVLSTAYDPGYGEHYAADEYRSPYLQQVVDQQQVDPISRVVRYYQNNATLESNRRLLCFLPPGEQAQTCLAETNLLQQNLDAEFAGSHPAQLSEPIENAWQSVQTLYANQVPLSTKDPTGSFQQVNLHSQNEIQTIRFAPTAQMKIGFVRGDSATGPFAIQNSQGGFWITEVRATGTSRFNRDLLQTENPFARQPDLAAEHLLQNRFFLARVDPITGGIRSVGFHNQRVNLLTQKLGMRIPQPDATRDAAAKTPSRYTKMVADSIRTLVATPLEGCIESVGKLLDKNQPVAKFRQTMRVIRGVAEIQFQLELEPLVSFQDNVNHYLCNRIAWKEESSSIAANAVDSRQPVTQEWFHATRYINVGDEKSFTLLTGGLPYHRRATRSMLDSVLMMKGERCTQFAFSILINQRYPHAASLGQALRDVQIPVKESNSPGTPSDWLFHIGSKNVLVTGLEPCHHADTSGVRLTLLETEGRKADLKIRSHRTLMSAQQIDFNGQTKQTLEVSDGRHLNIAMPPFAQRVIQLNFQT